MMRIKIFYFFKQNYISFYIRKFFFLFFFIKKKINIIYFLFWIHYYIYYLLLTTNSKLLVNYRYISRNFLKLKKKKKLFIFYYYLKHLRDNYFLYYVNLKCYFVYFFSKFYYYYYFIRYFFKRIFFIKKKNFFLLHNYFYSKIMYRLNYFEYFWIFFQTLPIYLLRRWKKNYRLRRKKWWIVNKFNRFSYLFRASLTVEDFFNINKNNSFLILTKKVLLKLNKPKRKFKRRRKYRYYIKKFKKKIMKLFIRFHLRRNLLPRRLVRRFGWYFRIKKKRKIRRPRRLINYFKGSLRLKKNFLKFKYTEKRKYVRKLSYRRKLWLYRKRIHRRKIFLTQYRLLKIFKKKLYNKQLKFVKKNTTIKLLPSLKLILNYSLLRKVLLFLSSSTLIRSINKIRWSYSIFSNFRLIYTIFSDPYFLKNLVYIDRRQRFRFLFKFIRSKFLKRNIQKSLYNFMFNSNVIYSFFIPKMCKRLLVKTYRRKKLSSFSWIFFTQISNLFFNLFFSNFFFNLNFTDSEKLNRSYLNRMFSHFLLFNPPKSKYHFLKELCDIYLLTGITKDSNLLHKWLIRNMSILFFRQHWQFLRFFKMTLLYTFKILKDKFNIQGLFVTFRGKIGQVGSVRKKAYFLKQGVHPLANLGFKMSFNTSIVKTDTGAIGVSVYLFY